MAAPYPPHPHLADAVTAEVARLRDGAPVATLTRRGVVTLFGVVGSEMRRIAIDQGVSRLPGVVNVRIYLQMARP